MTQDLDALLTQILNRRATIEQELLDMASGKKSMPSADELRDLALRLGTPHRTVNAPSGQVYGIIDPDYGRVYTMVRKLAWEEGYAIGLHGSFTRDLDLMAVPWAERCCEPMHLVRRAIDATGLRLLSEAPGVKPHGRLAWTLLFPAFEDPRFVDLSIVARQAVAHA